MTMTTRSIQTDSAHPYPAMRFIMQYIHRILFFCLYVVFMTTQTAQAVTISASPTSANVGQNISFIVRSTYNSLPYSGCYMQIDFGDGSGWINMTPPCTDNSCTNRTSHAYSAAGSYRVRTQVDPSNPDCPVLIEDPKTASTAVTITEPVQEPAEPQEINLPDGVVGMDYEYELGNRTGRYQLISGRMDPGLKILFNQIKGVPEKEGKYRFMIRATGTNLTKARKAADTIDTWYNLKITKALLRVTPDPKEITLDRNRSGSFTISYLLTSTEQLDDTITSARGVFLAGNRALGTVNTPLTTQMTRGRARVSERVTIPLSVIKTAQRLGMDKITYQRTFKAQYMDAATTSTTAITVGTGFTFTHIRITFLDKTSKKFVKRNEKIDGARVELTYEGAGLLKGYWQVDDRILARVTKTLPFANSRTITLMLPKVPPLPTHATGSHRLRFVITNPPMNIAFPQIIYIVTGEDLSATHPIRLLLPRDNATVGQDGLTFSWQPRHDTHLYKLEILPGDAMEHQPVFSAYTGKTTYSIPAAVAAKKFSDKGTWRWQVIGLDRNRKPIAKSGVRTFRLNAANNAISMVPGRILMLFSDKNNQENSARITAMLNQYDLKMEKRTMLPHLGSELVIFSTTDDVDILLDRLQKEQQGMLIQADYLYSTLAKFSEGANREKILHFLGLNNLDQGGKERIAIIDTGVDLNITDLKDRIMAHANCVDSSPYRGELHGTAVASIIGARIDGQGVAGLAPQSNLIALRACEQTGPKKAEGRCYSSSLLKALDRAMEHQATIVNMSIGTKAKDTMVATALDKLADAGTMLVAPAGNDPAQTSLSFPASHAKVVSVAGQSDEGHPMPNATVAAQADLILPGQYVAVELHRTSFMHGTSMASAEAAGLFAALHPDADRMADCRQQERLIACLARSH